MKRHPLLLATGLLVLAGAAGAHPGDHGHALPGALSAVLAGLSHPLGLDHLLAMVAVGLWSAAAWPPAQQLRGPAAFLLALVLGAAAGLMLGAWPSAPAVVEFGIAGSVLLLALLLGWPRLLPRIAGLALVAAAGALHGLAHGAELPAGSGFVPYALGFVATTALLHAAGLGLGRQLLALPQRLAGWGQGLLAGGLGVAGLALLLQA